MPCYIARKKLTNVVRLLCSRCKLEKQELLMNDQIKNSISNIILISPMTGRNMTVLSKINHSNGIASFEVGTPDKQERWKVLISLEEIYIKPDVFNG